MRKVPLVTDNIYHIFNRGVNKQNIFSSESDYDYFLRSATHYLIKSSKFSYEKFKSSKPSGPNDPGSLGLNDKPKVKIIAYVLMPNHFHFLMKQIADTGITSYMQQLSNSYSHYFNTKHERVGPLFQSRFKNVLIETDEQFTHLSRYIHLNPLVSGLTNKLSEYPWSSYLAYLQKTESEIVDPAPILEYFTPPETYEAFVSDQADYARELEKLKHLTFDN